MGGTPADSVEDQEYQVGELQVAHWRYGMMTDRKLGKLVWAALAVATALLPAACGGRDAGLSRADVADVEEVVRAEMVVVPAPPEPTPGLTSADVDESILRAMAAMPQPEAGLSQDEVERIVEAAVAAIPEPQSGLTFADVDEAIRTALSDMPQPEPGLTSAEPELIARGVVASIPPRSAPADYTGFFVDNAISRYPTQRLDATLAHYNREESVDGQWYVFIIDENDRVIGHHDAHRLGLDLKGWVGNDAIGYNFGPEVLSATEDGKWVSYLYSNPEGGAQGEAHTGALEYKHVWVVRHDGLIFASG